MILKLGRLRLALLSREGECLRTLDPRNRVIIKLGMGKKRIQHTEIFKGEPWKAITAENRWEVKRGQTDS